MNITVRAFAKINLYLEVLKKLPECKLHPTETVMQSVSLYDLVQLDCRRRVSVTSTNIISVSTDSEVLNDLSPTSNSVYIACESFLNYFGFKGLEVSVKINKNIPLASGLGGESADAAAVLLGLSSLMNSNISDEVLYRLAKGIGCDVSFCAIGGTMLASCNCSEGRLTGLKNLPKCYILICKPNFDVLTKNAYKLFDDKYKTESYIKKSIDPVIDAINTGNIGKISSNLFNRFETVLNNEEIFKMKELMLQNGASTSLMTGSGSAVFGIFKNYESAFLCKEKLEQTYNKLFICEPVSKGCVLV